MPHQDHTAGRDERRNKRCHNRRRGDILRDCGARLRRPEIEGGVRRAGHPRRLGERDGGPRWNMDRLRFDDTQRFDMEGRPVEGRMAAVPLIPGVIGLNLLSII